MEANFWHDRWQDNRIGFHEAKPNELLTNNFARLNLAQGECIFIPLCGKTLDMAWFLSQGYKVVGAELSQIAIEQLFDELGVEPQITNVGNLKRYSHTNIDIYVGDIFDLTQETVGQIDAIYDRAAMVALPAEIRIQYAKHLIDITSNAKQMLICFDYNQSIGRGPPFSVNADEINQHYNQNYRITHLENTTVEPVTAAISVAVENIWLLESIG